ncbi:hypothetical protein I317_06783 [Kwoniella heveanensis CBS 569]|nr:hypothetical protein I317_06783 [Kwoniella heveanensis CBS 569]
MSSNPSTLKQRHYAALSSRLKSLQANLAESELQLDMMAEHLGYMNRLGVACGSQFMAVSRLLDVEIAQANEEAYAPPASSSQQTQDGA